MLVEAAVAYALNPHDTFVGSVHGGLGWAFVSADGLQRRPEGDFVQGIEDDSFSLHGGLTGECFLTPGFFSAEWETRVGMKDAATTALTWSSRSESVSPATDRIDGSRRARRPGLKSRGSIRHTHPSEQRVVV